MPYTFAPASADEIRRRVARSRNMLRACEMCELRCGADRTKGERAPCGLKDETWSFKRHISYAEEVDLLPSYMVYFGACNFRCRFCVQGPDCFDPKGGVRVDAAALAEELRRVVDRGARTVNLLGGEPSMHLHTILEIALHAPEPLPLLLNTNMYMTPEVIEMLDGVVETYIADFKFGNDGCARRTAGIGRYVETVQRNLLLAARHARVIVRHLLMPGHVECCLAPVASWMAREMPEAPFSLMTGYVPAWRAGADPVLGRLLTPAEREQADGIIERAGLRRTA